MNYAVNHWDGLTLFLRDGRVEVDSNTVERSMRPIAMGRRNSLFSGSEGGAESWAILVQCFGGATLPTDVQSDDLRLRSLGYGDVTHQ
ncbi:IS66 family transposase [Bradyrhizobium elkanii]|uniref:IS66 family transposase n=1 Tax=Bradyrhizobium elkanii TaxID=29448 RepID=UPI0020A210A1|nr:MULTISPECIES: IS66 family transposase [Bradyrhizobium]MDI2111441.1 transposase [Bradyrhizobium sp. Mp64]